MDKNKEKLDRVMRKRKHVHKSLSKLFSRTNVEARTPRNTICLCGSGKKWKKCCIKKYEKRTKAMQALTIMYRDLTVKAVNLKRKLEVVNKHTKNAGSS